MKTLTELEFAAVQAAREAGALVASRFGGVLEVSSKGDRPGKELVTDVDRASQKLIASLTVEKFTGHMLLGEEDPPDKEPPASDFIWAVDPIDGTTNFVNGLPVHAVSIGVLHRGVPVAGAVWIPWPASGPAGAVLHARRGGGTWFSSGDATRPDARRLEIRDAGGDGLPAAGRLSGIPGGLRYAYRVGRQLRKGLGELRVSGSTAYETSMVAARVMQFSVTGFSSRVWDYAATSLLTQEAGGAVYMLDGKRRWTQFSGWQPFKNDAETSTRLRKWSGPMIMAPPKLAGLLSVNLRPKRPSLVKRAFRRR
jgi:myo-inositol-1(or 4)-monophosphatase